MPSPATPAASSAEAARPERPPRRRGGGSENVWPSRSRSRTLVAPYLAQRVRHAASRSSLTSTPVSVPKSSIASASAHSFAPGAQQRSRTSSPGCTSRANTAAPELTSMPYRCPSLYARLPAIFTCEGTRKYEPGSQSTGSIGAPSCRSSSDRVSSGGARGLTRT